MRIEFLQISNVRTFPYSKDFSEATKISFRPGGNIILGENGSGKSTLVEVVNFIFKRVIFKKEEFDRALFDRWETSTPADMAGVISFGAADRSGEFELSPNWDSISAEQRIRIFIALDESDYKNIDTINKLISSDGKWLNLISGYRPPDSTEVQKHYQIDIVISERAGKFRTECDFNSSLGLSYLHYFSAYRRLIELINEQETAKYDILIQTVSLVGSFRNFFSLGQEVNLSSIPPDDQMRNIDRNESSRSTMIADGAEQPVFSIVKMKLAKAFVDLFKSGLSELECEKRVNSGLFLSSVNEWLQKIALLCSFRLVNLMTWSFRIEFSDLSQGKKLIEPHCLSAGQKAILHLLFEVYGRGEGGGGLIVIDEPETHLHPQFQMLFLSILEFLIRKSLIQFIVVTHSEAFISAATAKTVIRLSRKVDGSTTVNIGSQDRRSSALFRLLDVTRSCHAFFARRVILVEGPTDLVLYRSIIEKIHPLSKLEVAIVPVEGKKNLQECKLLLEDYGIDVRIIGDLDCLNEFSYGNTKSESLGSAARIAEFKARHPDWNEKISELASKGIYILSDGAIEQYCSTNKSVESVLDFCANGLETFLGSGDERANSLLKIVESALE